MKLEEKKLYCFTLVINGEPAAPVRLRYIGKTESEKWLLFINEATNENHFCKPEQFPKYVINGREQKMEFIYSDTVNVPPAKFKPGKPVEKKNRPGKFFSFDAYKKSLKW